MNNRLQQFLAAENITQAQFADSINVARASVSHILAGRNKPGFDFINNMVQRYPTLNVDWLITGRGKMYKNGTEASVAPISVPEPAPQPVQKEPAKEPLTQQEFDDLDLLFPKEETDIALPNSSAESAQMQGNTPNTQVTIDINTLSKLKESISNQKKATKVIIFYNDGTFQEL